MTHSNIQGANMKLGAFSISLNVKDLKASQDFYEKLGFAVFGGAVEQNYLIMKNEGTLIGLFQGMFETNSLTFNPGWDQDAQNVEGYEDVRAIQAKLKEAGLELMAEAEGESGPGSLMLMDPDGNPVLIDQHI
jgi:catechol 2,3-dioxygenase-like lactoylglutathione lyase family enzyme